MGGGLPRPHRAHRRARQEPRVRGACGRWATRRGRVATSRRRRSGCAAATPDGPCTTRATRPAPTPTCTRGCTPRPAEVAAICADSGVIPGLSAVRDAAGAEPAVRDVRVRARHGQRPRRARHLRRAGRREPAPPRRVRLGVARPRDPHAHRRRHAVLRLRRRLRRGRARRQLRHGRHGAARRHPDARAGGVRGGERAGRPAPSTATIAARSPTATTPSTPAPAVRRGGRGRRRGCGAEAEIAVPAVAAGGSATVDLPDWKRAPRRRDLGDGARRAGRRHRRGRPPGTWCRTPSSPSHMPARPAHPAQRCDSPSTVCDAEFDERTGRLRRLFGLDVDGPRLELWRAPTDNDRGRRQRQPGRPLVGEPLARTGPGPARAPRRVGRPGRARRARPRPAPRGSARTVDVTYRWHLADEVTLRVEVVPSPDWDCTWPRVGVRFDLPPTLRHARWFGTGPHESYPDSARAARRVGAASTAEPRRAERPLLAPAGDRAPPAAAHAGDRRRHAASGSGCARCPARAATGPASPSPRTPRRRSTGPAHPHELPPPTRTYLFLDDAVHGLGSAACGVDVAPEHSLWPGARAFAVVFEEPA